MRMKIVFLAVSFYDFSGNQEHFFDYCSKTQMKAG